MASPAQVAAGILEAEIDRLGKPTPGSPVWMVLQAKSLSLSFLRAAAQRGVDVDPQAADLYRKACREYFNSELGAE